MTTPQFLAWLDEKFEEHAQGKLVPPRRVLTARLEADVRGLVRRNLTEKILSEAHLEEQVEEAFAARSADVEARARCAEEVVRTALEERPEEHWSAPVGRIAEDLTRMDAHVALSSRLDEAPRRVGFTGPTLLTPVVVGNWAAI